MARLCPGGSKRHGGWVNRNIRKMLRAACDAPAHDALRAFTERLEGRVLLAADVIINEIMYQPINSGAGADPSGEYIELYNRGDAAAGLSGWHFSNGINYTFSGGVLGAGQYLVVAADLARFNAKYPGVANVVGSWAAPPDSGSLSNHGETIELDDQLGIAVDTVSYATQGDWAVRGHDRGVFLIQSITRSGATATATIFGHGFGVGDSIQISGADQPEYNGTFTVSAVANSTFTFTVSGSPATPATFSGSGSMTCRWLVDRGHTGWEYTSLADGLGRSLELINPALSNDDGQNWAASTVSQGTPGAVNSVASNDIAPEILATAQSPLIPKSTDPIVITARVVDEVPTGQSATLFWRLDSASPGAFTPASMHDDGLNGDVIAGDHVWTASIPPQANNAIVQYYLTAKDAGNHMRQWPSASGANGANLLAQVDNTVYTGSQPLFKLVMSQNEAAELVAIGDFTQSFPNEQATNAAMNATVIAVNPDSTKAYFATGVRNRGGGSRTATINNYRVEFNTDNLYKGVRGLNFNAEYSMEDIIGSAIARMAGGPAQNVVAAQVRVNNVNKASSTQFDMFGSYSMLEVENGDFATKEFPTDDKGNYYRGSDPNHNSNLSYLGTSPSSYLTSYSKQNNSEANDWTDLINLTKAFDAGQTPDAQFVATVQQHLNVPEWMNYFAVQTLLDSQETALGTGYGDDYSLYSGVTDPRFQIIAHDFDTILNGGDTAGNANDGLFRAASLPTMSRFLKNPAFAPIYYQTLLALAKTTFAPGSINAILDNTLASYVPQATIDAMKAFAAARVAGVLAQIPTGVTAAANAALLPAVSGYPRTAAAGVAAGSLTGTADPIKTASVRVNGQTAVWTDWSASWTAPALTFLPGINRVLVQALDANSNEVGRTYIDVWYDKGSMAAKSGTLTADAGTPGVARWTAANGPYHVTADVVVPVGLTLKIDPGVSVFFDVGTGLNFSGGILDAEGTDTSRIRLARVPGQSANWKGLTFTYASYTGADNKLYYVDQDGGDTGFGSARNINGSNAAIRIDHMNWFNTVNEILTTTNTSISFTNSVTPTLVGVQPIDNVGMPVNGYAVFANSTFGTTTGHSDIIDYTGGFRPGPVVQFLNNVFLGTGTGGVAADDILDIDGTDAHVEGNIFMHVVHAAGSDTNSAISGGNFDYGQGERASNIVSIRNLYYDVDQAFMMKEGNFITSINDTFVHVPTGVFVFDEPGFAASPGAGGYAEGGIFFDAPNLTVHVNDSGTTTFFRVNHSYVTGPTVYPGIGNTNVDPHLVNPNFPNTIDPTGDFALRPGPGPAVGAGFNGLDMGGLVPAGASVSGEPSAQTTQNSATLSVGGPNLYNYKYRVNNGPWSAEIPLIRGITSITRNGQIATATLANHGFANGDLVSITGAADVAYDGNYIISNVTANTFDYTVTGTPTTPEGGAIFVKDLLKAIPPIQLTGLAPGTYTVYVAEKDDAGVWQADAAATASKTWTVVNSIPGHVRINEFLADNKAAVSVGGKHPDLIELYNDGGATVDLSDMSITDDPTSPRNYVFTAGTTLGAGQYLTLYADVPNATPGIHLGFALALSGEEIHLYDTPAHVGAELDSVVFGHQLTDVSVSRMSDGTWRLSTPTFGAANAPITVGDPSRTRINEWLTHGVAPFNDDFIELYNPDSLPVDIGGSYLTDKPTGNPTEFHVAPLTFIPGSGFIAFASDGHPGKGSDHTNFKLSVDEGQIALFDPNQKLLDQVIYQTQRVGVSQGRLPDGGSAFAFFSVPNPAVSNPAPTTTTTITSVNEVTKFTPWQYDDGNQDLGSAWTVSGYNDANTAVGWHPAGGLALLYAQDQSPQHALAPNWNKSTTLAGVNLISDYPSYYFRTHFNVSGNPSSVTALTMQAVVDDGAVIYLNGHEVYRYNVPTNTTLSVSSLTASGTTVTATTNTAHGYRVGEWITIAGASPAGYDGTFQIVSAPTSTTFTYAAASAPATSPATGSVTSLRTEFGTWSTTTVADANTELTFDLTSAALPWLLSGDNVLAVQVHQANAASSDIVWGATLTATQTATTSASPAPLRITEINYNPTAGGGTPYISDDYQFIEVKNVSGAPLAIGGMHLAAGVSYTFDPVTLPAGGTYVVAKNRAAFTARYGTVANLAATEFADALDNGGEEIRLVDQNNVIVQDFAYSSTWYPGTDGNGYTLTLVDPNQNVALSNSAAGWRASKPILGSPGIDESTLPQDAVVVNELLTNSGAADDWIELRNTTGVSQPIAGWYLSDSASNLLKYRIPAGTPAIAPNGFIVFHELTDFGNPASAAVPFAFNGAGDSVYLSSSAAANVLGGYRVGADFGASDPGVTIGRYVNSAGKVDYTGLSAPTENAPNAAPQVGPVVINEIMYHPLTNGAYIELQNITGQFVPLYDPANPANAWQFTQGITFSFPAGAQLAPYENALVVAIDPALFRTTFNIPASVAIYGPYGGALNNSGETVEISKPGVPLPPDPISGLVTVPYISVDQVGYGVTAPWPLAPDGTGPSLSRISTTAFGDDPINWTASATGGTPGAPNHPDNAPVVVGGANATVNLTQTFNFSGSVSDPDAGQPLAAWVDWGDGTPSALIALNPDNTFAINKAYTQSGTFNVKVIVSDADGLTATKAVTVTVLPVIDGTSGPDAYYLKLDASGNFVQVFHAASPGPTPDFTIPLNTPVPLTINGLDGDDQFIVDLTGGIPLPPAGATFDGGTGSNTVKVIGTAGNETLSATATALTISNPAGAFPLAIANIQNLKMPGGSGGSDSLNVTSGAYHIDADTPTGTPNVTVSATDPAAHLAFDSTQHLAGLALAGTTDWTAATPADRLAVVGSVSVGGSLNVGFGFTPSAGDSFTLIDNDGADPVAGTFSGLPEGAVFTVGGQSIQISYVGGTGNDVTLTVVSIPPAPTLVSRTIDTGTAQRSLIRSLTFTFSSPVTLAAGAITLFQVQDFSGPTGVDASAALGTPVSTDGGLTWKVPVIATSAFSALGSLIDGVYQTTVHANLVTDSFNQHLSGGDQTGLKFHRLFGDINGDKRVNASDYQQFSAAFGSSTSSGPYVIYFDFNHDNRINATDYQQFSARFGKSFIYSG